MRLQGKIALITGGGSGFGEGIARVFAREGAQVVVADIDGDKANAVAKDLGGLAYQVDLANGAAVDAMAKAVG